MRAEAPILGKIVAVIVAGLAASVIDVVVDGSPPSAVPVWAAVLAVAAQSLSILVRAATRSRMRVMLATTIGCWLVLLGAVADAMHVKIFRTHVGRDTLLLGWDAWRNGVFRLGAANVAAAVASAVVLLALVHVGVTMAFRLPVLTERREERVRAATRAAAGCIVVVLVFRDLVFPSDAAWTRPLFWHHPLVQRELRDRGEALTGVHFGESLVDVEARAIASVDEDLRQQRFAVTASRDLDVLLVHVESLRADMLTAERMPKLFAWSKRCTSSSRHYSTSNATGGGAFGALSGLSATYFSTSRRDHVIPPTLRVLEKLGYERRVWFPNEALVFDHLRDVLFANLAEARIAEREPVDEADALTVDGYIRTLDAGEDRHRPRFDYVVLDSSHYDYAYPDAFAKHLPVSGLSSTLNRRTGEGKVLFDPRDVQERRAGGLFNRYQNSVLYVDSLVDRVLVALEKRARLDRTIVAIFGDHGEAFWDRNEAFGHGSALTDAQTRVPFVLCSIPSVATEYRVTSHADIFPTVFDLLGVRTERPFMTGKSLVRYVPGLDYAIVRFPVTAVQSDPRSSIVVGGFKIAYVDELEPRALWVRDANDDVVSSPPADLLTNGLATVVSAKLLREPRPP